VLASLSNLSATTMSEGRIICFPRVLAFSSLEEANVALAKLQERDEADKDQIFEDQQKKNQEGESIMFQQINELTQQKQQAENKVKSCQAKLEQCQKQIINYEKNTLDLQQQLKEQSFIAEDKSRQQVEDLQQKLETMQKEEKLASKHNDYSSKQSKIERLMEQLEARLLEITDYKREIDANNVSVALV